jgi:corrinoid protein of di/trimethylamine methyltransferase
MDEDRAVELAHAALAEGMDAYETIMQGLAKGMGVVSDKYDRDEYFVPEILICADAMYAALAVLRPHLRPEAVSGSARVVIGVIEGDVHDIGKNIVKMMMEGAGFEVTDLGRDVPAERFVEEAVARDAEIIAISTLMSTTMRGMGQVVELLEARGLRDRFQVLIGGGPLSESFAREIRADAYAPSASEGVRVAQRLVGGRVA